MPHCGGATPWIGAVLDIFCQRKDCLERRAEKRQRQGSTPRTHHFIALQAQSEAFIVRNSRRNHPNSTNVPRNIHTYL